MGYKNLFIFLAGAAVGSLLTYKYVSDKKELEKQVEIDSVKEAFKIKEEQEDEPEEVDDEECSSSKLAEKARAKADISEYADKIRELGYSKKEDDDVGGPYVISPHDFGQYEGEYDEIELTYYAGDGVLADDMGEKVEDVENKIGFDSLNTFGQYEEDSVFVRNDKLKTDYEILRDSRKYSEVFKNKIPN